MGERLPCKQEVTSSNLVISIGFQKESNVYLENRIQKRNDKKNIKTSEVIMEACKSRNEN